jgi:hypothetical protein
MTEMSPNIDTIFHFENRDGLAFGVSLKTMLECLRIAEQQFLVPPFEPEWASVVFQIDSDGEVPSIDLSSD